MILDNSTKDLIYKYQQIQTLVKKDENSIIIEEETQKLIASSILSNIILSKKIFKKNIYVKEFLNTYFDMNISKWMMNSRTLMCGKVCRYIHDINDTDKLLDYLNTLFNVLVKIEKEEDIFSKDIYDVIRRINI
nr:hypothetical protein [Clostridioides sp.]